MLSALTGGREFAFFSFVLTKGKKATKKRKTTRGGLSHVVAEPAMARAASVRPHSHGSLLLSPRSDSRAGAPPLWTPPFKNDHTGAAAPMWRTPGNARTYPVRAGHPAGPTHCRISYAPSFRKVAASPPLNWRAAKRGGPYGGKRWHFGDSIHGPASVRPVQEPS